MVGGYIIDNKKLYNAEKERSAMINARTTQMLDFIKESTERRRNNMRYKLEEAIRINYNDNLKYEKYLKAVVEVLQTVNRDLSEYYNSIPIGVKRDLEKILNIKTKITYILEK